MIRRSSILAAAASACLAFASGCVSTSGVSVDGDEMPAEHDACVKMQHKQDPQPPVSAAAEIVVKFKDDAKVKDIVDLFWKNPSAAKARFDAFKLNRPEMAGAKLDRVTYSNELVLVFSSVRELGALRKTAAQLAAAPDIAYAEPNMIAHPQH